MSLRDKAYSASRWTAFSGLSRIGIQVVQTAILARLLHPSDFGLMALVGAMLAIAYLFSDMGVSRAIIHFEHISHEAKSSLFWFNVGLGLLLSIIFAAAAPAMAALYGQRELMPALLVASPIFLIVAIGQQHCVVAEKELRFATLAINEIVSVLVGLLVAVLIAVKGGGVYALVLGALTTATSNSLLAWARLSHGNLPSMRLNLTEAGPFLRYGGYLTAENLANTLLRQADLFLGGWVAPPSVLGMYALPRDLSMKMSLAVNPIITRIGFPVMSRLQGDRKALAEVYRQTLLMTSSINIPAYVALGVFAEPFIAILYGPQWNAAVPYLRILSAWGLLRSINNPIGSLLYASGRAQLAFWWSLTMLVLIPPVLWLSSHFWDLPGMAWTLAILQAVLFVPSHKYLILPACGLGFAATYGAVTRPLIAAGFASLVGMMVASILNTAILQLAAGLVVMGVVYLVLSFAINRAWVNTVLKLLNIWRPAK